MNRLYQDQDQEQNQKPGRSSGRSAACQVVVVTPGEADPAWDELVAECDVRTMDLHSPARWWEWDGRRQAWCVDGRKMQVIETEGPATTLLQ
jgi:hypothetical protein